MPTRSQNGKTIHDNALADIQNADAKTVIATLPADDLADLLHWCGLSHCTDDVCQAARERPKTNVKTKTAAANGGALASSLHNTDEASDDAPSIKLRNTDKATPEKGEEGPHFS